MANPDHTCDPCNELVPPTAQGDPGVLNPAGDGLGSNKCSNESPFSRVVVSYLGGVPEVFYELDAYATMPGPLTFQLQFAEVLSQHAPWVDIGNPVVDVYSIKLSSSFKPTGKLNRNVFRLKMTDGNDDVHYSDPVSKAGTLSRADWLTARQILKQKQLELSQGLTGQMGFLLKRRITGEKCPRCTDQMTSEILDPECSVCWGTGRKCGYYYPIGCVWAAISPMTYRAHLDGGQTRGTVLDVVVKADMINTWILGEGDVWINAVTNDRYYIHTVQNTAEIRGVPLTATVELRVPPFTDIIYDLPLAT